MPWNVCDIRMVSEERAKLADLCEVIFVDQENMMMMVMGNEWNGTPAKRTTTESRRYVVCAFRN